MARAGDQVEHRRLGLSLDRGAFGVVLEVEEAVLDLITGSGTRASPGLDRVETIAA